MDLSQFFLVWFLASAVGLLPFALFDAYRRIYLKGFEAGVKDTEDRIFGAPKRCSHLRRVK
jgi:hypothetical protein